MKSSDRFETTEKQSMEVLLQEYHNYKEAINEACEDDEKLRAEYDDLYA